MIRSVDGVIDWLVVTASTVHDVASQQLNLGSILAESFATSTTTRTTTSLIGTHEAAIGFAISASGEAFSSPVLITSAPSGICLVVIFFQIDSVFNEILCQIIYVFIANVQII